MKLSQGVRQGDLGAEELHDIEQAGRVAWDIETTSLDWTQGRIATCQVATSTRATVIQLQPAAVPQRLLSVLENGAICKAFHHAVFDLRFMTYHWGAAAANIACTKIASKIIDPSLPNEAHSLKPVLARHLAVHIDKGQRLSDWSRRDLTAAQVEYALDDVVYLLPLLDALLSKADAGDVRDLVDQSYAYIPTRVVLDLRGAGDVYRY